jgi:hypothetical protein
VKDLAVPPELLLEKLSARLPDGPVDLFMAVFGADGSVMGVAPVTAPPAWRWHDGSLTVDYGDTHVPAGRPGVPRAAYLVAVAAGSGAPVLWRPALRVVLDWPQDRTVPAGTVITVTGTSYIQIRPSGPNDPAVPPTQAGW